MKYENTLMHHVLFLNLLSKIKDFTKDNDIVDFLFQITDPDVKHGFPGLELEPRVNIFRNNIFIYFAY